MALVLSNQKRDSAGRMDVVKGQVALSGTYPTGGETFDASLLLSQGIPRVPFDVLFKSLAGYMYTFVPGATPQTCKIKVLTNTGAGVNLPFTEHTNVAYNAGVTGDTITFTAFISGR